MKLNTSHLLARTGEQLAEDYFRRHQYDILDRNYRCSFGEIDLIVEKNGCLVFVEVKTRSSEAVGSPEEAVHLYKQKKLYKTAQFYLKEKNISEMDMRFDVISILLRKEEKSTTFQHFENAFEV